MTLAHDEKCEHLTLSGCLHNECCRCAERALSYMDTRFLDEQAEHTQTVTRLAKTERALAQALLDRDSLESRFGLSQQQLVQAQEEIARLKDQLSPPKEQG